MNRSLLGAAVFLALLGPLLVMGCTTTPPPSSDGGHGNGDEDSAALSLDHVEVQEYEGEDLSRVRTQHDEQDSFAAGPKGEAGAAQAPPSPASAIAASGAPQSAKPSPVKAEAKVGRNDPCPCGSGKKYKKCCGAQRD